MKVGQEKLYRSIPEHPGVYLMRGEKRNILYVGKAANLKRRVSSYFLRPQETRIESLIGLIKKIEYRLTDTALEALILEAELIKKHNPPFNVREKDDTSFLFIEIGTGDYPTVLLVRGKDKSKGERFGPFTSAKSVREALRVLRRIFPWSTHLPGEIGKSKRACLNAQIGICPGTCTGSISSKEYKKILRELKIYLKGKKKYLLRRMKREMEQAAKSFQFEKALTLKNRIFALQHIQDVAFVNEGEIRTKEAKEEIRIEGYDISNISGTSPVGVMVVFEGDKPNKQEYRKFKIKTVKGVNDIAMLIEVVTRRLNHPWPLPRIMLIDGGLGQTRAIRNLITQKNLPIAIIGIAKGPERKRNDFFGLIPEYTTKEILVRVRDEAHRFAIRFHRTLRGRGFLN